MINKIQKLFENKKIGIIKSEDKIILMFNLLKIISFLIIGFFSIISFFKDKSLPALIGIISAIVVLFTAIKKKNCLVNLLFASTILVVSIGGSIVVKRASDLEKIIIVDVFYDGTGQNEPDEYVEIQNQDTHSIQLKDWLLYDEDFHVYYFLEFRLPQNSSDLPS